MEMICEHCKHYDKVDYIEVCNLLMEAIDYMDTEDCEYFEDNDKQVIGMKNKYLVKLWDASSVYEMNAMEMEMTTEAIIEQIKTSAW